MCTDGRGRNKMIWVCRDGKSSAKAPVKEEEEYGSVQKPHRHPVVEQPQHKDRVDPVKHKLAVTRH